MDNIKEIRRRIGQDGQLFGVRESRLVGGRADGMRLLELENGVGLQLELLPDRGLDPYRLRYKGINLSFITNVAPVGADYTDSTDDSFKKHFNAGLMTTCGLQNVGVPNDFHGDHRSQHGRYPTIPATEVCAHTVETADGPVIMVEGKVQEARFFGETLTLLRRVEIKVGENKITFRDRVRNDGYEPQSLMLLYHCNLGYPLVDDASQLILPPTLVTPRDAEASKGVDTYMLFHNPVHNYAEQCFYLDSEPDAQGMVSAALYNKKLGLALQISFNKNELPYMTEWKQMGEKFYVVGIEPGNCHVEGAVSEEERGTLTWLQPGEEKEFGVTFTVLEGNEAAAL